MEAADCDARAAVGMQETPGNEGGGGVPGQSGGCPGTVTGGSKRDRRPVASGRPFLDDGTSRSNQDRSHAAVNHVAASR